MSKLLLLVLLLLPLSARAQDDAVCPPPNCTLQCAQADVFLAYEPTNESKSGIFRGINACDPANTTLLAPIAPLPVVIPPVTLAALPFTIPPFLVDFLTQRWNATGPLAANYIDIRAEGFHHPQGAFMVTDLCGTHIISVGKPIFAALLTPSSVVVCFEEKNLNKVPPPPGFDRSEDVCVVVSI
jgi:hypothetical protein